MNLQKWLEYGWLRSHKSSKKKRSPIFEKVKGGSRAIVKRLRTPTIQLHTKKWQPVDRTVCPGIVTERYATVTPDDIPGECVRSAMIGRVRSAQTGTSKA